MQTNDIIEERGLDELLPAMRRAIGELVERTEARARGVTLPVGAAIAELEKAIGHMPTGFEPNELDAYFGAYGKHIRELDVESHRLLFSIVCGLSGLHSAVREYELDHNLASAGRSE